MQIACERCATVYTLDDRLIPPGGAPVQCTRCGLVFTARPTGAAPSAPAAVAAPRHGTAMFGASPSPAPAPHATQMFGAAGSPASPPAPASGSAPADPRSTQMFGGADGPPPASGTPAAAAASPRATQMFGAVDSPAAAHGTPVYGTPAVSLAPGRGAHPTQMFGAASGAEPAAAASPRATQMFGALGGPGPANAPRATQMFGAASASEPAHAGEAGVPHAAPVPGATGAPAPHSTQMFGAASAPAPRSTQMFGAAGAPVAPPRSTQMFGAAGAPAPSAHSTQMFGAAPGPVASAGDDAGPLERTLTFGQLPPERLERPAAAPAGDESGPLERTLTFGQVNPALLDAPRAAKPASAGDESGPLERTLTFGQVNPALLDAPRAAKPAPAGDESGPLERTLTFGQPSAEALQRPADGRRSSSAPQAPAAGSVPAWLAGTPAPANGGSPAPSRAGAPRPRPSVPSPLQIGPSGPQTRELQQTIARGQRRGWVVLLAVLLGVAIAGASYLVLTNRTPRVDVRILAADAAALQVLERDDDKSLRDALGAWEALSAKVPDYAPALANRILAEALVISDLREEIRRLTAQATVADRELKRLEEKKDTLDWVNRANARREELARLKAAMDPLVAEASRRDESAMRLVRSTKALVDRTGLDKAAVLRSWAVFYGFKGHESAARLLENYRGANDERQVLHDPARAWADLAAAAFESQGPISPEKRNRGIAAAEAALKKNPKLMRAHLLAAKLELGVKDYSAARRRVNELLVLNPGHKAAARLKSDIAAAEAAAVSGEGSR